MSLVVEAEIRSFISPQQYTELIEFFKHEAEFIGEDDQETYYFDCPQDLRIQKNNSYAKIWLKKGALHDESREEIEVKFPREDFEKLEQIFLVLGFKVEIKWFRKRHTFRWQDISVMIDFTRGYGHVIELEKMTDAAGKDEALKFLLVKLAEVKIPLTSKQELQEKFEYYKEHWRELVV